MNYGGRVTDDKDVRLIAAVLDKFYLTDVCSEKDVFFDNHNVYISPKDLELKAVKDLIL